MEGRRATRTHAHARTHTQSVCGVLTHPGAPRGSWPVLRLRVQPPRWCGAWQWGHRARQGAPTLPGGPCSLLLISVRREPAKPSSGKDGHFNNFKLPEETCFQTRGLCLGNRDSPGAAEICPGRGAPGGREATRTGRQFLTRMLPAPGVSQ